MNQKQEVLTEDGLRYVMGVEEVLGEQVPCKMPVVNECSACSFEWPDVLTPSEVKAMKEGLS